MIPMRGAGRDYQLANEARGGNECECGERGLSEIELDAGRCELCHTDKESRRALRDAERRARKNMKEQKSSLILWGGNGSRF